MPRVLITGANRGLGLEFSRQYAADGWHVIAGCRKPHEAAELKALDRSVAMFSLDVADEDSIAAFLGAVSEMPVDVAILNAGVSGPPQRAADVKSEQWGPAMLVNALAPVRLVAGLRANLENGQHKKAVAISSLAASMAGYEVPGQYSYRASKAALNSLWRTLSIEWRPLGITCILLRPGKVRTRMTGFAGDLAPRESVQGMRAVIAHATLADSGRFIGYDGAEVPW
jgi:NAD(P)-dependent dehydrogenase (short-subunit alcohol dehydrogenase family)